MICIQGAWYNFCTGLSDCTCDGCYAEHQFVFIVYIAHAMLCYALVCNVYYAASRPADKCTAFSKQQWLPSDRMLYELSGGYTDAYDNAYVVSRSLDSVQIQLQLASICAKADNKLFRIVWDEIIIHRLRIGHTYLTHGHLFRGEAPPRCLACLVDLTVEHVLLHCVSFTNPRDNCFCVTLTSMSELFLKVASRSIIAFIKETGFYLKI